MDSIQGKLIWHCKLSRNMLVLQWSAPLKDWKGNKEMAREHLIYSFKLLVYGRHVMKWNRGR